LFEYTRLKRLIRKQDIKRDVEDRPVRIQGDTWTITDRYNLRCEDFLMPEKAIRRGDELTGGHPIHGSETGHNLHIDTRKNVWHCFRCGSGGGPVEALAVAEGIIPCGQAGPGCLDGHWPDVMQALSRHGYGLPVSAVSVAQNRRPKQPERCTKKLIPRKTTDLGNSERFCDQFGDDVRFCPVTGVWYVWDNTRWLKDETDEIMRLADAVARRIYEEAASIENKDIRAAVGEWARKTEAQAKRVAMVKGAGPYCAVRIDDFNPDGDLLNFLNGTLNLRTGEFRSHQKEDMITKIVPCDYDPRVVCPLWLDHLELVFGGDQGFVTDFQILLGYMLIHGNPEQILVILHGNGQNGKSVTSEVLKEILGDYATAASSETFMSRRNNPGGARSDLVDIMDKRLVIAGEGEEGRRLDESIVKLLTGDDSVKVRNLYESERDFKPSFTVMMHTNHRPRIKETSHAIWRRLWLVPFEQRIPDEKKDPLIKSKLVNEASGIINWLLQGVRRYYDNGGRLPMPERIKTAIEEYRAEEDPLAGFISDMCEIDEFLMGGYEVTRAIFGEEYRSWCTSNGERPISDRQIAERLKERGIETKKAKGVRKWVGIRLKSQETLA
jgi:putative DNA primase/helicase